MRIRTFILQLTATIFLLCSCSGAAVYTAAPEGGDTLQLYHSSLLQIVEHDGYSIAEIKNPWKEGAVLHRYMLLHKDSADIDAPQGTTLLRTPLDRQLIFATVHAELLATLGCAERIAGVCDAQYMSVPAVQQGLSNGLITDCGSSMDINMERLMELSPQAAWVIPYKNGGYGKMELAGIPLIECVDYMETSPLGGAEWMRFYGRLFGLATKSDSLFWAVCNEYESLRNAAKDVGTRPKLMCELKSSSAWYVPCGGSTMGRMYADAGADYLFSAYGGSGSVPLSYEVVLDKAADADVWLFKYNSDIDRTYASLLSDFAGYSHFKPFRQRDIYACNTRYRHLFEETSFHPERLLKDLVAILHPQILPNHTLRYYEKMF